MFAFRCLMYLYESVDVVVNFIARSIVAVNNFFVDYIVKVREVVSHYQELSPAGFRLIMVLFFMLLIAVTLILILAFHQEEVER